jgi:CheY-like chemotaxis protein
VVEDNAVVRATVVRALRHEGYTVFEAEDGEAAWAFLSGAGSVNMLVTDIVMPRLDGIQLSRRLTASGKQLPFLFISGYDQNPSDVPGPLLPKPFGPAELVTEVQRIMPTVQWSSLPLTSAAVRRTEAPALETRDHGTPRAHHPGGITAWPEPCHATEHPPA